MITIKITDSETGEVLLESVNARGVMCVVAEEESARGHSRFECSPLEICAMVGVWQDIMADTVKEFPILEVIAPYLDESEEE